MTYITITIISVSLFKGRPRTSFFFSECCYSSFMKLKFRAIRKGKLKAIKFAFIIHVKRKIIRTGCWN